MNVYDVCLKAMKPNKKVSGFLEPLRQLIKHLKDLYEYGKRADKLLRTHDDLLSIQHKLLIAQDKEIQKLKAQRPIKIIKHVIKPKKK